MVDTIEAPPAPPAAPRRSRRRLWIALGAAVVLVTGGTITAFAISFKYLHAPRLSAFGFGWLPPDNAHYRFVRAGPYDATVIPARPDHWQTFEVDITNPSSVTQTVLVPAGNRGPTAEPERLTISATDTGSGDSRTARYTTGAVSIPPGGVRTLHLSHFAGGCDLWGHGQGQNARSEYWTELELRVRVGWFTRTEVVDFDNAVMVLQGTSPPC